MTFTEKYFIEVVVGPVEQWFGLVRARCRVRMHSHACRFLCFKYVLPDQYPCRIIYPVIGLRANTKVLEQWLNRLS